MPAEQTTLVTGQSTYGTAQSFFGCVDLPLEHLKLLSQHSETSQKHTLTYGVKTNASRGQSLWTAYPLESH